MDYRTYLDYDIKVTNTVSGQQAYLSRVSRDSSGGENQAPFYVAICASLLQIYQKSENSIRPYCDITYSIVRHGDANAIAPFYRAGTLADAPEKETEYE